MPKRQGETTYKSTAFGIIPRSQLIPLEIEGVKRATSFILQKRLDGPITITPSMLKRIHAVGFGWIFPKMGGIFRAIDVHVSHHQPPKYYTVPVFMEDFCRDATVRIEHLPTIAQPYFIEQLIQLLAWAHHRFLWIHPFQDYNGRIGRLLINIILLNLDLPVIELKVETIKGRKKYINALQEADNQDTKKLEKIIEQALQEAAHEIR